MPLPACLPSRCPPESMALIGTSTRPGPCLFRVNWILPRSASLLLLRPSCAYVFIALCSIHTASPCFPVLIVLSYPRRYLQSSMFDHSSRVLRLSQVAVARRRQLWGLTVKSWRLDWRFSATRLRPSSLSTIEIPSRNYGTYCHYYASCAHLCSE
ncbi:hypothetical protein BDZ89DRAFT_575692 [Hymenopellis radicata]|nr:hypothetical protein BDZ89DRAFT_575692 [Hymenopellis radicata]